MSDADSARGAKALQDIAYHLKQLVLIHTALNENLVTMARDIKQITVGYQTVSVLDVSEAIPDNENGG